MHLITGLTLLKRIKLEGKYLYALSTNILSEHSNLFEFALIVPILGLALIPFWPCVNSACIWPCVDSAYSLALR